MSSGTGAGAVAAVLEEDEVSGGAAVCGGAGVGAEDGVAGEVSLGDASEAGCLLSGDEAEDGGWLSVGFFPPGRCSTGGPSSVPIFGLVSALWAVLGGADPVGSQLPSAIQESLVWRTPPTVNTPRETPECTAS